MAAIERRSHRNNVIAVVGLLILLLGALHLMSSAIQDSEILSHWFIPLLVFTVVGLIVLVVLIGINLLRLLGEYRRHKVGSRLTLRMVILFIVLAMTPVSVVYYYSLNFLLRGIDSWFDVQTDSAMEDALDLGKASLGLHKKQLLHYSRRMLDTLQDSSQAGLALSLDELVSSSGATEILLMQNDGQVLAASSLDPAALLPAKPDMSIIQQVAEGKDYVGILAYGDTEEVHVRCVIGDGRGFVLQVLYPTSERINLLSERVQTAYEKYKESAYLRQSIKFSFSLTLSLVLLVGVFAAVLMAFFMSRILVAPIRHIASGTRAVADGDYDQQLPVPASQDELSFLVASFNAMTRRISTARQAAEKSKAELAVQHAYLETVLGNLSSGVMALDGNGRIKTANMAAHQILQVDVNSCIGQPLDCLVGLDSQLTGLVSEVKASLKEPRSNCRREVLLERADGRQVVLCGRSRLYDGGKVTGFVMLLDDVTILVQAQRDAAWGEVARRLAHEIKNPLTPIQLSAERLRRKYLKILPDEDKVVMDKATTTIVNQVEAMKMMVNAFSDYAKPSRISPEVLAIDDFIADVLALYDGSDKRLRINKYAPGVFVSADPIRLRQVIHNLVKNAYEALADAPTGEIQVETRVLNEGGYDFVELVVTDNGPGIDPTMLSQVFEPYVTHKVKGTGLGLAIVKKIVEEHGGTIHAENRTVGGAKMILKLPVVVFEESNNDVEKQQ